MIFKLIYMVFACVYQNLYCRHREIDWETNVFGDQINLLNCRSIWICQNCHKRFYRNRLMRGEGKY